MSTWLERWLANRFILRVLHKSAFGAALLLCLAWNGVQALVTWASPATPVVAAARSAPEWPLTWDDGAPLRPLAPSEVEQRFARRFPGAMARLTDGRRTFVMRQVDAPTRMLHPAADCYRALGWKIEQARLERDRQQRLWRCFAAVHPSRPALRVCERIVDARGAAFTDTSAWYWAAAGGSSQGPWQAITVAELR
ncbi:MAG: hypothetical protein EOO22_01175 [Comamonadaceae bacterium]|nr:MAG: hypothetical protein EOO22_01175 [Comamonadaceae bacterium]